MCHALGVDDATFLAQVRDRLPEFVYSDYLVTAVQPTGGRPWSRTEVTFVLANPPSSWQGPTQGSAFFPLEEEWRYAAGYEDPDRYAQRLANEVQSAAYKILYPGRPPFSPTPQQVIERWQWLLERLALHGPVRQVDEGQLVVEPEHASPFSVLVTPEEWAPIAEPLDLDADDPQDFNRLDEEAFLVFYEGRLEWSVLRELPPVDFVVEIRGRYLAAEERGETNIGWVVKRSTPKPERPSLFDTDLDLE